MRDKKNRNDVGNLYCNLNGFVQLVVKHVQDTDKILKRELDPERSKNVRKRGVSFSVFTKVEFVNSRFDYSIDEFNSTWYNVRNMRIILLYFHLFCCLIFCIVY